MSTASQAQELGQLGMAQSRFAELRLIPAQLAMFSEFGETVLGIVPSNLTQILSTVMGKSNCCDFSSQKDKPRPGSKEPLHIWQRNHGRPKVTIKWLCCGWRSNNLWNWMTCRFLGKSPKSMWRGSFVKSAFGSFAEPRVGIGFVALGRRQDFFETLTCLDKVAWVKMSWSFCCPVFCSHFCCQKKSWNIREHMGESQKIWFWTFPN